MAAAKAKGGKIKGKKVKAKTQEGFMVKKSTFNLTVPSVFTGAKVGVAVANKSHGTYHVLDSLRGRTFEVNQADLNTGATGQFFRKFKFSIDGLRGNDAVSRFNGMELTSEKIKSIPRKWHSLIQAETKVSTTDGYVLRVFTIAITKRKSKAVKKNCYATVAQAKAIRKIIFKIIEEETTSCDINEVVKKLMSETIGTRIEQEGLKIYPLQNCHVSKVKVLKKPKADESELDQRKTGKKVELS